MRMVIILNSLMLGSIDTVGFKDKGITDVFFVCLLYTSGKIKTEIKKNRDKLFIVAGKWESAEKYNHFISNIYSDRQVKVIR